MLEDFLKNLISDESIRKWIITGIGIVLASIVLFVVWLFNHIGKKARTTKQKIWLIERCLIGTTIALLGLLNFIEIYRCLNDSSQTLNMTDVIETIKLLAYCVIVSAAIIISEDAICRLIALFKERSVK